MTGRFPTRRSTAWTALGVASVTGAVILASSEARGDTARSESDPAAIAVAEATLEAMGGADAWERTRCLRWRFLGKRLHHWDRWTGDVRIETEDRLVLMNLHSREGRVWDNGVELSDPAALESALEQGYAWWVNDSYWFVMPYKLLDPGVRLADLGNSSLPDGRAARKIGLTFDEVGLTPRNRYEVWIADDTGLVEQWAFYPDADDAEPRFVLPWAGWERFGEILLATEHGRGFDWEIAVLDRVPPGLFEAP